MDYNVKYIESLDETLYSYKHKTGLRVFVIPKVGFSKTYAIYGTKFGSVNNTFVPLGKEEPITVPDGVAHFLEHKMFEQSDGTNAFDIFSKYGANANAYTSFTNTCYLFSSTKNFDECFTHLISYVNDPYFTDENIQKEQGIIGQEIRMYDDEGEWVVMFNMLRAMYHNNPVRIDIAGTVESISKIDKDVLYNTYNTYYNPANMVICVVGDVKCEHIFEMVDKCITDKSHGKVNSIYPQEPFDIKTDYIEDYSSVNRPIFSLGFKDNYLKEGTQLFKRELALRLLLKIITGKSSNFYKENYDTGLINDTFETDVTCELSFSNVSFGGECDEPKLFKEKLLKEIKRYKDEGFDNEEFTRIKKAMYGSYMSTFNNVEAIGNLICRNFLNDVDATDFVEIYNSISLEDLNKVLNEVLDEKYCVLSVIYPHKN